MRHKHKSPTVELRAERINERPRGAKGLRPGFRAKKGTPFARIVASGTVLETTHAGVVLDGRAMMRRVWREYYLHATKGWRRRIA